MKNFPIMPVEMFITARENLLLLKPDKLGEARWRANESRDTCVSVKRNRLANRRYSVASPGVILIGPPAIPSLPYGPEVLFFSPKSRTNNIRSRKGERQIG